MSFAKSEHPVPLSSMDRISLTPRDRCLDHLVQHECPICRERFSPRDTRKLHVERDPATASAASSSSSTTRLTEPPADITAITPQVDNESQRLLDDIARIVKEGGKFNEIRRVIDECRAYSKSLPGNQVRISLSPC